MERDIMKSKQGGLQNIPCDIKGDLVAIDIYRMI